MAAITPINDAARVARSENFAAFSTSGSVSANFLDEALAKMQANRTGQEQAITTALNALKDNPTDHALQHEVQVLSANFNVSKAVEGNLLSKLKTAFEKLVLSPS